MKIERNIAPFVVSSNDTVLAALQKITDNKARIVFCLSTHGILEGSFSDGDFRRWVAEQAVVELATPVGSVAHTPVRSAPATATTAEIAALFTSGVDRIPLVDERGHVVAIASDQASELTIGRRVVGPGHPTFLIAEIGNNHNGSLDLARQLIDFAAEAGVDCVKFQMRDMAALYRQGDASSSAGEDLGAQYTLDLLSKVSLTNDELFAAFDHARQHDIEVMCTPWDSPSIAALVDYGLPALKIASADLTNHELLREAGAHRLPLILSTGMATEAEIRESADVVRATGAGFAMLHCQSTYPAPFKDVNLSYMTRLGQITEVPVGYSGHERGFHVPLAAVALGASIIEKHFTVDRSMEGNDHKVSLLPAELAAMVRQTRELEEAMGTAEPRVVSTGEQMNRVNLAKSLVATRRIEVGETVQRQDVAIKSPGRGLQPNHLDGLVGRTMRREVAEGDFFYATDLTDTVSKGRAYNFGRPWGLPVRYHDFASLITDTTPDFLEFHLSFKDVEMDLDEAFAGLDAPLSMGFTVHTPDLYAGDFIIDVASDDDEIWQRSLVEVQRVIDITRDLRRFFASTEEPVVIATLGGFTEDRHIDLDGRRHKYGRVAEALRRLDTDGVRLTAQTLPPYPWLMGGQQYHNLFMDPRDTKTFCEETGTRLTFDTSHSKLASTFLGIPFSQTTEILAPLSDHLHLVDATGVDGEGPQVGEGEIDWPVLAEQLHRLAPGVGFIPEIWMGHVNNGEGFWTALERLEAWF